MTMTKAVAISKKDVAKMKYKERQGVTSMCVGVEYDAFLFFLLTKARQQSRWASSPGTSRNCDRRCGGCGNRRRNKGVCGPAWD